jgi:hypothetical protein
MTTTELPPGLRAANIWLDQIRTLGIEPDQATIDRVTADCHWDRPCGDCAAELGQPHADGCDVARCMRTGEQRIACNGRHDCGSQIWEGMWPGQDVAIEHGFYSYFGDGWVNCGPEDPRASPDLSCWRFNANWDQDAGRWTLDAGYVAYLHNRRQVHARGPLEGGAVGMMPWPGGADG